MESLWTWLFFSALIFKEWGRQTRSKYNALGPQYNLSIAIQEWFSQNLCQFACSIYCACLNFYENVLVVSCSHEIVNIALKDKPEWYTRDKNLDGTVPTLEYNGHLVSESVICNDLLDENPDHPLYPKDPWKKAQ